MSKPSNDILIALMGPTGSGKSSFINMATGKRGTSVGNDLESETSKIHTIRHKERGYQPIVFVDTPGFNDTNRPDTEILTMIGNWLKKTYDEKKQLTGIIYLHRVTDNRVPGSVAKNFTMFQKLCGKQAARKVVLVSTMWSLVKPDVGRDREKRVQELFWKDMIAEGSKVAAFDATRGSAWSIIRPLIESRLPDDPEVLLEDELTVQRLHLSETQAGKTLYDSLQKELYTYKEAVRKLRDQAQKEGDEEEAKRLEEDYREAQKKLDATFEQLKVVKIALGRRISKLWRQFRA